jgi:hypothetical protein
VDALPLDDAVSLFGLHENAKITYGLAEASLVLRTIVDIQPRVGAGGSGGSAEATAQALALRLAEELPEEMQRSEALRGSLGVVSEDGKVDIGSLTSLQLVLLHELERFNHLLSTVSSTLRDLQLAIKGVLVMSADLEHMFSSMLRGEVPAAWARAAYPSLKPLASWHADLKLRVAFIRSWLVGYQPERFMLPYFFMPQGFLTGVLQTHARKHRTPIDYLSFSFRMLDEPSSEAVAAAAREEAESREKAEAKAAEEAEKAAEEAEKARKAEVKAKAERAMSMDFGKELEKQPSEAPSDGESESVAASSAVGGSPNMARQWASSPSGKKGPGSESVQQSTVGGSSPDMARAWASSPTKGGRPTSPTKSASPFKPGSPETIGADALTGFVPEPPPEDGVLIEGLYLAGARYNRTLRVLQAPRPKQMVDSLPAIHMEPVENHVCDASAYECPLYKTSARAGVLSTTGASTNFVVALELPTKAGEPPTKWIRMGVAALCATDD